MIAVFSTANARKHVKMETPMSNTEITRFTPDIHSTKGEGLTRYVAGFVLNTGYDAIPDSVMGLGKKSLLDGLGLAIAGSVRALPRDIAW